jgi:hypothetical protein
VKLTTHLHLVPKSKNEWSYTSALQYASVTWCSVKAQGQLYLYLYIYLDGYLVGLLGWGISLTQGLYLNRTTQHGKTRTHIHASSGIRTPDPSVRTVEDITCLRPLGPAIREQIGLIYFSESHVT